MRLDPSQQQKYISGAVALAMHLMFIALLMLGVNWQHRVEPQSNIVDLWANLPQPSRPIEAPRPRVEPDPKPELKPQVKPQPRPPLPEKAPAKAEAIKPDIALKDKVQKERREAEEKDKLARKRDEEVKLKAEREREAELKRVRELEDAQKKLAAEQAAAQASARNRLRDEYIERIRAKIKRFIVIPPNLQGNPEALFDVVLLPGGEVLNVKLSRASGNSAYDSAVERAILNAQPLPLPSDPAMFRDFRELNLRFRPQE